MKKLLIFLFLLATPPCDVVWASAPTRPNTYTTGTTIRASDVTLNETTLYNYLQAGVDTYVDGSILSADIFNSTILSEDILDGTIVNADVNSSAAIAYSKLSLSNSIVNADISSSAAIAYSKLNLATSIVNADVSTSAAIAGSKLAEITEDDKVDFTALNVASEAQGDIMYRNVSGWVRLGAGTDGNYLETNGAGANPSWTSPSRLFPVTASDTFSSVSSLTISQTLSAGQSAKLILEGQGQGPNDLVIDADGSSVYSYVTHGAGGTTPTLDGSDSQSAVNISICGPTCQRGTGAGSQFILDMTISARGTDTYFTWTYSSSTGTTHSFYSGSGLYTGNVITTNILFENMSSATGRYYWSVLNTS